MRNKSLNLQERRGINGGAEWACIKDFRAKTGLHRIIQAKKMTLKNLRAKKTILSYHTPLVCGEKNRNASDIFGDCLLYTAERHTLFSGHRKAQQSLRRSA